MIAFDTKRVNCHVSRQVRIRYSMASVVVQNGRGKSAAGVPERAVWPATAFPRQAKGDDGKRPHSAATHLPAWFRGRNRASRRERRCPMIYFGACPKCQGDLALNRDNYGRLLQLPPVRPDARRSEQAGGGGQAQVQGSGLAVRRRGIGQGSVDLLLKPFTKTQGRLVGRPFTFGLNCPGRELARFQLRHLRH